MTIPTPSGFSVVIPTYKEAKNIHALLERLEKLSQQKRPFEVIIVDDDSRDGIAEIIIAMQVERPWLRLLQRTTDKGLSASVLAGFAIANYPLLVVMDADLSHPPEKIPSMLLALEQENADMVIGSRYVTAASTDEKWPWFRQVISFLAALAARQLVGTKVKDPLAGFFVIRQTQLQSGKIEAIGWKIGLEIMIKTHCKKIIEVPIHFSKRFDGASKLNYAVALSYLKHLKRLAEYKLNG